MIDVLIFYGLSIGAWLVFEKIKIPSAAILGPLFVVGAASFLGLSISLPILLKPVLSLIMGVILGLRFDFNMKGLLKELGFVTVGLIVVTLLAVYALIALGVDNETALFAAAPGGMAEITLMSMSFGADPFVVALLQLTRLLATMMTFPFLIQRGFKNGALRAHASVRFEFASQTLDDRAKMGGNNVPPRGGAPPLIKKNNKVLKIDFLVLGILGIASSYAGLYFNVPAGAMVGPMLIIAIYANARHLKVQVGGTIQKIMQVGVGGMAGLSVTRESVMGLATYILPIVALDLIIVGGCVLLAMLLRRFSGWDAITCLMATSPGGLSFIILLAMEKNLDVKTIAIFQALRMALVLLLIPLLGNVMAG
jgi:membrane AbrB-like protein